MKPFKIFTSGKMGGLNYSEQMSWRLELENMILRNSDKPVEFMHPPRYFDYNTPDQTMVKKWELNQISDSDIVIVDLSTIKDSIGTHIELGFIEAINKVRNKNIFVIGLGKPNTKHPWIDSALFYRADTIEEISDFILTYLLI